MAVNELVRDNARTGAVKKKKFGGKKFGKNPGKRPYKDHKPPRAS